MKARELADILMQHPDMHVCMEYIPYNGPPSIQVTPYPAHNVILLDYGESDETDWDK